jgi:hypothetical protein
MANVGTTVAVIGACTIVSAGQAGARRRSGRISLIMRALPRHERKGNGPVSAELKVPPPALTLLAKKNNGVIPFNSVYETIDGRKTVVAHGTRDMPIWGDRFESR